MDSRFRLLPHKEGNPAATAFVKPSGCICYKEEHVYMCGRKEARESKKESGGRKGKLCVYAHVLHLLVSDHHLGPGLVPCKVGG